jgi:hypothetical protein
MTLDSESAKAICKECAIICEKCAAECDKHDMLIVKNVLQIAVKLQSFVTKCRDETSLLNL